METTAEMVYEEFQEILSLGIGWTDEAGELYPIPKFDFDSLRIFIEDLIASLGNGPTVIRIKTPIVIVGNLHGSLHDLLQIFAKNGLPPRTRYLFLGSYVDFGEFSLEVVTLLFAMKLIYPENIFLLRGEHEISDENRIYGFYDDLYSLYKSETIWTLFNKAFSFLPIAAIVSDQIFCVHAGLSATITRIDALRSISLPISDPVPPDVTDFLINDPKENIGMFLVNKGKGCKFGIFATNAFLKANNIKYIIRSHQCVESGTEYSHEGKIVTVFSSSSFKCKTNCCGYGVIAKDSIELVPGTLPPVKRIGRSAAFFKDCSLFGKIAKQRAAAAVPHPSNIIRLPSLPQSTKTKGRARMNSIGGVTTSGPNILRKSIPNKIGLSVPMWRNASDSHFMLSHTINERKASNLL